MRAIAIWEALGAFDAVFATEAGFQVSESAQHQGVGRQHRETYVKLLISKTDKSMRRFEDAFLRTLRVVGSWLQAPSSSSASGDDDGDDGESHETLLAHFLLSSFLLEVAHLFLSNNALRDWIAHSETHLGILDLMKMLDYGLESVLRERVYAAAAPSSSSGPATPGAGVYNPLVSAVSLSDLVKQLETHRTSVRDVTSKIQFPITVDKLNKLCGSMSYLLLQQMVGGF